MSLIRTLGILIFVSGCATYSSPQYSSPRYRTPSEAQPQLSRVTNENYESNRTLSLSWPLRGGFYLSRGFLKNYRPHQGLDLVSKKGAPIRSAHDGYVEYAGHDFSGYGKLVIINSGANWATFYAHLNRIHVKEGDSVRRGQHIGDMGATGNARGVHLHFELRYNQRPVDPLVYLPQSQAQR